MATPITKTRETRDGLSAEFLHPALPALTPQLKVVETTSFIIQKWEK